MSNNYTECIHYYEDELYNSEDNDFLIAGFCSRYIDNNDYDGSTYCCLDATECKYFETQSEVMNEKR